MASLNGTRSRESATGLTALLTVAIGAALVLIGGAARALAADETAADALKTLKGTWVSDEGIDSTWTFEGETLKATVNGQDYTCKVKADPKAKPATLDFLIDEGPEDAKGRTAKCIYKLDGEKLILCLSQPGKDRPKAFEQNEGESYLFELKREKVKDKEKDEVTGDALKTLKGTWVSGEGIDSTWTFEGETLKATVNGLDYTCKVKIDPKAKPATIDLAIDEGPEDAKGKTSKCIYKLEGEKLILCVSLPGKDRPKEFEQNEGEAYVFELKKEKPKDKDTVEKQKTEEPKA
jgi:uncharacterized protein (TIGR03067 family)